MKWVQSEGFVCGVQSGEGAAGPAYALRRSAGRIVALAEILGQGAKEIDAHCPLDQPMAPPARMADDFLAGTRSAACSGTTAVIPFAARAKGESLKAAVTAYHQRAEGKKPGGDAGTAACLTHLPR